MAEKEKLFPLFYNKLDLITELKDEQIVIIIRALGSFTRGEEPEIQDGLLRSIYNLLISDVLNYDTKCEQVRRRVAEKRERDRLAKENEQPKEEKPEKEKEADSFGDDITEIVDYLNQRAGTRYKAKSKKTAEHIRARLREGFTVGDFKIVIDKMVRVWTGTEMEKFIRPETLFNSEKFEGYLNRTDKTDAEMAQEAAMHKKYDGLLNWAQRKEAENDASGIYEDDVDHIGELPDFSKF